MNWEINFILKQIACLIETYIKWKKWELGGKTQRETDYVKVSDWTESNEIKLFSIRIHMFFLLTLKKFIPIFSLNFVWELYNLCD